jgi:hypothetical protein
MSIKCKAWPKDSYDQNNHPECHLATKMALPFLYKAALACLGFVYEQYSSILLAYKHSTTDHGELTSRRQITLKDRKSTFMNIGSRRNTVTCIQSTEIVKHGQLSEKGKHDCHVCHQLEKSDKN